MGREVFLDFFQNPDGFIGHSIPAFFAFGKDFCKPQALKALFPFFLDMIMKEWAEIFKPSLAKIVLFAGLSAFMPLPLNEAGNIAVQLFGFPVVVGRLSSGAVDPLNLLFALLGLCFSYLLASLIYHGYELSLLHKK